MVRRSGLAERTFERRCRAATSYARVNDALALRMEEAKQLLERGETPIEAVAAEVGYAEPAAFRRLFSRRVGVSPARYRRRLQDLLRRTSGL